jgi:hypothetical protein
MKTIHKEKTFQIDFVTFMKIEGKNLFTLSILVQLSKTLFQLPHSLQKGCNLL